MNFDFVITVEDIDKRLDIFLSEKTKLSRSQIKNSIENGQVFLNGKKVKAGEKLCIKDKIIFHYEEPKSDLTPENIKIEIIYEDDDLAVINKMRGMVVHPAAGNHSGTLVNALLFHFKKLSDNDVRPGIVHRLDKDTSGLLIVAKNNKAHENLAEQIKNKTCKRHYLAIVSGNFKEDSGTIKTGFGRSLKDRKKMTVYTLGEKKTAVTHYKVLERFASFCFVEFVLDTGRTHQIRVHSSHLGHPIVGDELYGGNIKIFGKGQLLHAYKIEFKSPSSGKILSFETKLPEYFEKALNKLKAKN